MAADEEEAPSERRPRESTPLLRGAVAPATAWSALASRKRRLFLLVTEPESSLAATVYCFVLMLTIAASNVLFMMQTMKAWQFIPTDCRTCGGDVAYAFEDDEIEFDAPGCTCPPAPLRILQDLSDYLMILFTVEWLLRVVLFTPATTSSAGGATATKTTAIIHNYACQWIAYLTSGPMVLDFLAIFPYYLESTSLDQLVSLRLIRNFRIIALLRLGKFSDNVRTLTNVLGKSVAPLKILALALVFGGALFGSVVYNAERGVWKYWAPTDAYQYIRTTQDGVTEEISPFSSIPKSLWWFVVTATTVGYGDFYPTSTLGQCCGAAAMLTGVLVIAFPVSIFSDLWQHEMKANATDEEGPHDGDSGKGSSTACGSGGSAGVGVRMEREDLRAIAECIHAIRERQDTLSSILHKYKYNIEDDLV